MAGSMATQLWFSGDKPKVPVLDEVDYGATQQESTGYNLKALPGLFKLGSRIDAYNIDEILKGLEKMLPGYTALRDKGTELIGAGLRGEIPEDVSRQLQQRSAEISRAGGYAGSEMHRNLTARDFGLTSYDITQRYLNSAERWMQQARSGTPIYDISQNLYRPQWLAEQKAQFNALKFNRNWLANQIDAMPSNVDRALGALFDNIEQSGQAALGAYAGASMGGGGGMGGMGSMGGGGGGGGMRSAYGGAAPSESYLDISGTYPMDSGVSSYNISGGPTGNYYGHPDWYP